MWLNSLRNHGMCDQDLIPPRPDLTDDQWTKLDPSVTRAAALPTELPAATAGFSRRAVLGVAAAGAALAVLPPAAGRAQAAERATTAGAAKFPFPSGPNSASEYRVLITGDAGTGAAEQYAVAAAARKICAAEGVGLAVGLGDNLYENGPESSDDSEFATKFETPNAGIDVPWLMVLGNHDCSGLILGSGGMPERGDFEVAYAATSPRWYMPWRYYGATLPSGADPTVPLVEFFAMDTNPVASMTAQVAPYYWWNGQYMREQRAWLEKGLTTSRATWKIALGHHPYINNGHHGSAGSFDGFTTGDYTSGIHLKELYEEVVCGRADLILSGHDHTQQILEPNTRSRGTRQIVCGAAGKAGDGQQHGSHPARWQNFSQRGFMIMKVSATTVGFDAYTVDVATSTAHLAHSFTSTKTMPATV